MTAHDDAQTVKDSWDAALAHHFKTGDYTRLGIWAQDNVGDLVARVEQLEREKDSLRLERDGIESVRVNDNTYLLARIEQAERERDEAERMRREDHAEWHAMQARVAQLEGALREIAGFDEWVRVTYAGEIPIPKQSPREIARAALAGEDA
jgi:vacuolar-type H+-ATPase subunit I/STV1